MKINLENQINVCRDCFSKVRGKECQCGSKSFMRCSSMAYEIMLTLEEMDAPIHTIESADYINTEFIKAAGVA